MRDVLAYNFVKIRFWTSAFHVRRANENLSIVYCTVVYWCECVCVVVIVSLSSQASFVVLDDLKSCIQVKVYVHAAHGVNEQVKDITSQSYIYKTYN